MEHLELESPTLVGHSLGSTLSPRYAVVYGARSVVPIDPAPLYTPHLTDSPAPYEDRMFGDDFDAAILEWEFANFDTGPLSETTLRESTVRPRPEVVRAYRANLFDRAWADAHHRAVVARLRRWMSASPS